MMEINFYPPNGILFIEDPTNENVQIPEYIDGDIISHNKSCVSVCTQAYVDGEVLVKLLSEADSANLQTAYKVFRGIISTPGKIISIITSENEEIIRMNVGTENTIISIFVDDADNPGIIEVIAK